MDREIKQLAQGCIVSEKSLVENLVYWLLTFSLTSRLYCSDVILTKRNESSYFLCIFFLNKVWGMTKSDQIEKLINTKEFFNIQQLDIYLNKIKISNKTVRYCHQ